MDRADSKRLSLLCVRGLYELVGHSVSLMIFSSGYEATSKRPVGFVIDLTSACSDKLPISPSSRKRWSSNLSPPLTMGSNCNCEPSLCQLILQNCTLFMANVSCTFTHITHSHPTAHHQICIHTVSKRSLDACMDTVHAQYRYKYTFRLHTHARSESSTRAYIRTPNTIYNSIRQTRSEPNGFPL